MTLLLDLFCCAGGAGEGYQRAGFEVVGVDVVEQPRYPGRFIRADVFAFLASSDPLIDEAVAFHASPPCQGYTTMSAKHRGRATVADERSRDIGRTRDALVEVADGRPWVMENVAGAAREMRAPLLLSGGMFGLRVHRPRLFEVGNASVPPLPRARAPRDAVGVYGTRPDGRRLWTRRDGTELRCVASVEEGRAAMGITRPLEWREVAEAIPPAFTEYIGHHLLSAVVPRGVTGDR